MIASDSGSLREAVGDCGVLVGEGNQAGFVTALTADASAAGATAARRAAGLWESSRRKSISREAVSDGVDAMYRRLIAV